MVNPYTSPYRADQMHDPHWHRDAVGGMWEEIGKLQCDFLVRQGLTPDDSLLDIGCGSLRGGIHFIRYLNPGRYVGIDIRQELLDAGQDEVSANDLSSRQPMLVQMDDFAFHRLNRQFPYALAVSLFTHMPLNSITRCVMNAEGALTTGGRFFATFFENPQGKWNLDPLVQGYYENGSPVVTHFDHDPYHYDIQAFEGICRGTRLEVEYIGDWGHPRNQKMLVFRKRGAIRLPVARAWLARRRQNRRSGAPPR